VSVKHSSCFASFVLITKGDYPSELNISLPFSMVSNNIREDRLEVMPAYYWMYNLYALERNSRKAAARDKRRVKIQHIEMDYLAPDTAEEIISAMEQIMSWMGEAGVSVSEFSGTEIPGAETGGDPEEIPAHGLERNERGTVILKPRRALAAYRQMLHYYAVKTLAAFLDARRDLRFGDLPALAKGGIPRIREWVNMGGQIVPAFRVDALRQAVRAGKLSSWDRIHGVYETWASEYPLDKLGHAWGVLTYLHGGASPGAECFRRDLETALEIKTWITGQVFETRAKDYSDPFRLVTYRNKAEMERVAGNPRDNPFILSAQKDCDAFGKMIRNVLKQIEEIK
jgi:hypothetical protein